MDNFKNIKVGEFVYLTKSIRFGFSSGRNFEIKEAVERLTKTQFITKSGRRFKKDSGSEIGEYRRAKLNGKDQTNEMLMFEEKVSKVNKIYYGSGTMSISADAPIEDIDSILSHLEAISKLLLKNK